MSSVCEIGTCVVRNGDVVETRSWLVRSEDNLYQYLNMKIHGIRPEDAPDFRQEWGKVESAYLDEFDTLVAHNVPFHRSSLNYSAELYTSACWN